MKHLASAGGCGTEPHQAGGKGADGTSNPR